MVKKFCIWQYILTSLASREIQIKPTLRSHLTPVRMAILKDLKINSGEVVGKREPFLYITGVQPLWNSSWRFLRKLSLEILFDLSVLLLDYHPQRNNIIILQWLMCAQVYSSTAHNNFLWEQPVCPSIDEWTKKLWDIYI